MSAHRRHLEVLLRRAIECGDDEGAQTLAVELSILVGEPREDDRHPIPIDCWGVEQ